MGRGIFALSASVLAVAAGIAAACTGEDPDLTSVSDAGSENDANGGNDAPVDAGGVDGAEAAAPKPLTCKLQLQDPVTILDVPDGEIDESWFVLPTGDEGRVRIVTQVAGSNTYEIRQQRLDPSQQEGVHTFVNFNFGRLFSTTPTTSPEGTALFGVGQVDGGQTLVAFPVPNNSASPISADLQPVPLVAPPPNSDVGGRMIELISSTYFFVLNSKVPTDAGDTYPFQCGRNNPPTGPTTFLPFNSRPDGVDSFQVLKGNGTGNVYMFLGGFGPGAQLNGYILRDDGTVTLPTPSMQIAFPGIDSPPLLIAALPSAADPTKYDLILVDGQQLLSSPPSMTFWTGRVAESALKPNASLKVESPAFTQLPPLTGDDVPLSGGSGAVTAVKGGVAMLGGGSSTGGMNLVVVDVAGYVRAKNAPGMGFLAGKKITHNGIHMVVGQDVGGLGLSFNLAWIEDLGTDGGKHHVLKANRILCAP